MVLRVKPTPTRFPTNSLNTPMDRTPFHSIPSVCQPWGRLLSFRATGHACPRLRHCPLQNFLKDAFGMAMKNLVFFGEGTVDSDAQQYE